MTNEKTNLLNGYPVISVDDFGNATIQWLPLGMYEVILKSDSKTEFDELSLQLGELEFGDDVFVSDPCYEKGSIWSANITDLIPWTYKAIVTYTDQGEWGIRVKEMKILHKDYSKISNEEEYCDLYVDSWQMSICDISFYPNSKEEGGEYGDDGSFYDTCCKITINNEINQAGCFWKCFVSSTGYGDWTYPLILLKNDKGENIWLCVRFIE